MESPTYIIGHKNPDADAICSAIAYAAYKEATGNPGCIPARCGNSNARIDAILHRFGVPLPQFIGDVTPRIANIMHREPYVCHIDGTCAEALEIFDNHSIRALPVVDNEKKLVGQISIFDLGQCFMPKPNRPQHTRPIHCSITNILQTLRGTPVVLFDENRIDDLYVRIAAMDVQSFGRVTFSGEIPIEQSVIVVGDRLDIQERAIEMGVRLIVVSGNLSVNAGIVHLAKEKGVSIINSPTDSASTAWLIRAANKISKVISTNTQVPQFSSQEKLAVIRRKLAVSTSLIDCVVDDEGHLIGIFSKSDLLKPIHTNLILVDHNELSQAVDGAAEVNILEVIDHHRLGNPPTQQPILFINRPLGSTCTIVADLFHANGLKPEPTIAGILMGGIISDTLHLQSPTTTARDAELLGWLSEITGVASQSLAETIFNAGSILRTSSPGNIISSDCKQYDEDGKRFSVSQVEELGFNVFWKKADELLDALENYRRENALLFSALLVTDINTQNSLLLVRGDADIVRSITYPARRENEIFDLPGIVSRKKQLIPYLTTLLGSAVPA
ncbi:MAG: putative manganese-dependent inorganic diphosphatase [Puniceicoccales bacterium]|jgi:manganese-dependent inorganic pyrophosphatase|nr:putative manganese-dependent inorganic diphosphatase [Puniceicoccales bacterium]